MADIDIDLANFLEVRTEARSLTSATAVVLDTSTDGSQLVVSFTVMANEDNAGNVWIGGSNISSSAKGLIVAPGESVNFPATAFLSDKGIFKWNLGRIYARPESGTSVHTIYVNSVIRRRDA